MPFIPHTEADIAAMLDTLELKNIEQLFAEIPDSLPEADLASIPAGLNECAMTRLMQEREPQALPGSCFIGAGAYEHHIPAAVWELTTRGEFYTAYTPYQAEASQGSLQLIYEYQTMMTHLLAMDVSNASLYDGASALAEAILMAVRVKRGRAKRVLLPNNIHPYYRQVLATFLTHQDIILEDIPYEPASGKIAVEKLQNLNADGLAAVVIAQPNFFGTIEDVDAITDRAHELEALLIAVVNPVAMALLVPPGQWGQRGADIVCGEGQPLGVPLASGGPYFGFMCCKKNYVRQLPGRIVGRTEDAQGRTGYTLTLQAREQHIRRAKATSNICTNQGLLVTAATIHMALLGGMGLRNVAVASHHNARELKEKLLSIAGVELVFDAPFFHEFVIRVPKSAASLQQKLTAQGLLPGFLLHTDYRELENCLLVCATETKSSQDLERYQQLFARELAAIE